MPNIIINLFLRTGKEEAFLVRRKYGSIPTGWQLRFCPARTQDQAKTQFMPDRQIILMIIIFTARG